MSTEGYLILFDYFKAHPEITTITNIRTELVLPPNSTSFVQPMNQGVIRRFTSMSRKHLILMPLEWREKNKNKLKFKCKRTRSYTFNERCMGKYYINMHYQMLP